MTGKRKYEAGKQVTPVVWQFENAANAVRRSVTGYGVDVVGENCEVARWKQGRQEAANFDIIRTFK